MDNKLGMFEEQKESQYTGGKQTRRELWMNSEGYGGCHIMKALINHGCKFEYFPKYSRKPLDSFNRRVTDSVLCFKMMTLVTLENIVENWSESRGTSRVTTTINGQEMTLV